MAVIIFVLIISADDRGPVVCLAIGGLIENPSQVSHSNQLRFILINLLNKLLIFGQFRVAQVVISLMW